MDNLLIRKDHTSKACTHGENEFKKFNVNISEINSLRCEDLKIDKILF